MENLKPIKDTQVAYRLNELWHKLHTVHINQKHDIILERDKELVIKIMNEVSELKDQIRNKIYFTELNKTINP